jgi:hypothetical protein
MRGVEDAREKVAMEAKGGEGAPAIAQPGKQGNGLSFPTIDPLLNSKTASETALWPEHIEGSMQQVDDEYV